MTFGLGDCTPIPTVTTGADGQPRVVYSGCPTTTVDVLPDDTNVYHDNLSGKTYVSSPSNLGMYLMLGAGAFLFLEVMKRR